MLFTVDRYARAIRVAATGDLEGKTVIDVSRGLDLVLDDILERDEIPSSVVWDLSDTQGDLRQMVAAILSYAYLLRYENIQSHVLLPGVIGQEGESAGDFSASLIDPSDLSTVLEPVRSEQQLEAALGSREDQSPVSGSAIAEVATFPVPPDEPPVPPVPPVPPFLDSALPTPRGRSIIEMKDPAAQLGDILLNLCLVTEDELQEALDLQRHKKATARLGNILIQMGIVSEEQVFEALEVQYQRTNLGAGHGFSRGRVGSDGDGTDRWKRHAHVARRSLLGELLVELDLIDSADLEEALEEQWRSRGREKLGSILVRRGKITPEKIFEVLEGRIDSSTPSD